MTTVETDYGTPIAGKMGPAVGATWLHHYTPNFGLGSRIAYFSFAKSTNQGNRGMGLTANASQFLMQAVGRYIFFPESGGSAPYFFTGMGVNQYKARVTGVPGADFFWPDTRTQEPRVLTQRDFWGFVMSLGVGLEFPMGKTSRGAIDLIWNDAQVETALDHRGYSIAFGFHWFFNLD